jgi:hypothetical protein
VHNKERSPTLCCLVIQLESTTTRAFHACWELINSASEPQKRTKKGQLAINDDHRLLMDFVSSPRAHLMHALGYASAPFLEPDRSTKRKGEHSQQQRDRSATSTACRCRWAAQATSTPESLN